MKRLLGVSTVYLLVGASLVRAQPYAGAIVLQFPINARSSSMGTTGVADPDPGNLYFNPANVVGPARVYVQGSHWDLVPYLADDVWVGAASAGVCIEREGGLSSWGADVSYGRLDYGESIATDPGGTPLGTYHSFEEYFALTVGAALQLSERWELRSGLAAKQFRADYGPDAFTGSGESMEFDAFAFDAGATVALRAVITEWNVTPAFGVAFVNVGPDIDTPSESDDPLPTRFHFGSSVRVDSPTVRLFSADVPIVAFVYNVEAVERLHGNDFSWGIGGEFAVCQALFFRAGVSDYEDRYFYDQNERAGWGIGFGLPAGPLRARFDFARNSSFDEDQFGFELDWMLP